MTLIIQLITSSIYVKGFARILYKFRNFFKTSDSNYKIPGELRMNLNLDDYFENNILWGFYEPHVRESIKSNIKREGVFIDIGANIGFFTNYSASLVGSKGYIYSYKPNPECVERIRKNLELNEFKNVKILNKALSDSHQTKKFYVGKQHALSSLHEGSELMELDKTITVQVSTLDTEIQSLKIKPENISLIKIDVEGHEFNVFRGMTGLLKYKPTIIFENNPLAMKECGYSLIDIWENFIQGSEYDLYYLNSKKKSTLFSFYNVNKVPLDNDNIKEYKDKPGDILCI